MDSAGAKSALVVGAGVVGLACAYRLRRLGLRTTLIDTLATTPAASWGNAGHIATEQIDPLASWATIRSAPGRWFRFGGALDVREPRTFAPWMLRFLRAASASNFRAGRSALRGLLGHALPAWRSLVGDLQRVDLLRENGHVILWESRRSAQRRRATWLDADIGSASVRDLHDDELDEYAQWLTSRPHAGLRFSGSGQIADLGQLLQALRTAFDAAGGEFVHGNVRALEIEREAAVALTDDGRRLAADIIVIAAGIGSRTIMQSIGTCTPLIAERGYHVQWHAHGWPSGSPPVVFEDRSMIVTSFHGGLRAAGFVEFAGAQTQPDPRKWAALRKHAAELGLPTIGAGNPWIGARPTLPDYLPAIGRSAAASNVLYAFGHQHLGLTLAPVTAELVAALASGRNPAIGLHPFDLQRFNH